MHPFCTRNGAAANDAVVRSPVQGAFVGPARGFILPRWGQKRSLADPPNGHRCLDRPLRMDAATPRGRGTLKARIGPGPGGQSPPSHHHLWTKMRREHYIWYHSPMTYARCDNMTHIDILAARPYRRVISGVFRVYVQRCTYIAGMRARRAQIWDGPRWCEGDERDHFHQPGLTRLGSDGDANPSGRARYDRPRPPARRAAVAPRHPGGGRFGPARERSGRREEFAGAALMASRDGHRPRGRRLGSRMRGLVGWRVRRCGAPWPSPPLPVAFQ